jgi:hypothetical protein
VKRVAPFALALCLLGSGLATGQPLPELTASDALGLLESGALSSEEYVAALLQRADEAVLGIGLSVEKVLDSPPPPSL